MENGSLGSGKWFLSKRQRAPRPKADGTQLIETCTPWHNHWGVGMWFWKWEPYGPVLNRLMRHICKCEYTLTAFHNVVYATSIPLKGHWLISVSSLPSLELLEWWISLSLACDPYHIGTQGEQSVGPSELGGVGSATNVCSRVTPTALSWISIACSLLDMAGPC